MKKDFCLEILTEELPPSEIPSIIEQVYQNMNDFFKNSSIEFEEMQVMVSARRIASIVKGVQDFQNDSLELKKGPAKSLAFDGNSKPTKALEGFLRGSKASLEDMIIRDFNGVEYVYIQRELKGRKTSELLGQYLPKMIEKLNFKKPMKWGDAAFKFVRPVHGILCLLGEEVVEFELFGMKSGRKTSGHRFLGKDIEASNCSDYLKKIRDEHVILNFEDRIDEVKNEIARCEKSSNGKASDDIKLIEEVAYLTEYPRAIMGKFDSKFLELPKEVLITTLKHHQRTFPVTVDGMMTNRFISFQDNSEIADDNVRVGYEKVIHARLEDAAFYYREDLKKPLLERADDLKNILFQNRLGTMYEKVVRNKNIGEQILKILNVDEKTIDVFRKSVMLSKCDLVTSMIYEFPELQGVMGKYYAIKSGENPESAEYLIEQYSETVPYSLTGAVLSFSDKLDTVVGNYLLGNIPTGSKDPFGLRKKITQMLEILLEKEWMVDLDLLFEFNASLYSDDLRTNIADTFDKFKNTIDNRLESIMTDKNFDIDVIRACIHKSSIPFDFKVAVECLQEMKHSEDFGVTVNVFERVHNITKNYSETVFDARLFESDTEKKLLMEYNEVREKMQYHLKHFDYKTGLEIISTLNETINEYFEEVFIMCDREDLKLTRLGFLKNIDCLFMKIADLSLLEHSKNTESFDE